MTVKGAQNWLGAVLIGSQRKVIIFWTMVIKIFD